MEVKNIQENIDLVNLKVEKPELQTIQTNKLNIAIRTPKLPEFYTEIYQSYTGKEYQKCLEIIDSVTEHHIEYDILKSACLIHMGKKLVDAHKILDDILLKHPNNSFTIYAKGLAFYHEEKWDEAIEYFERARELDSSPDMERGKLRYMFLK